MSSNSKGKERVSTPPDHSSSSRQRESFSSHHPSGSSSHDHQDHTADYNQPYDETPPTWPYSSHGDGYVPPQTHTYQFPASHLRQSSSSYPHQGPSTHEGETFSSTAEQGSSSHSYQTYSSHPTQGYSAHANDSSSSSSYPQQHYGSHLDQSLSSLAVPGSSTNVEQGTDFTGPDGTEQSHYLFTWNPNVNWKAPPRAVRPNRAARLPFKWECCKCGKKFISKHLGGEKENCPCGLHRAGPVPELPGLQLDGKRRCKRCTIYSFGWQQIDPYMHASGENYHHPGTYRNPAYQGPGPEWW